MGVLLLGWLGPLISRCWPLFPTLALSPRNCIRSLYALPLVISHATCVYTFNIKNGFEKVFLRFLMPLHPCNNLHGWDKHVLCLQYFEVASVATRGDLSQPMAECGEGVTRQVLHLLRDAVVVAVGDLHQCCKALGCVGHGDEVGGIVCQVLEGTNGGELFFPVGRLACPLAECHDEALGAGHLLPAGLVLGEVLKAKTGKPACLAVFGRGCRHQGRDDNLGLKDNQLGVGPMTREMSQNLDRVHVRIAIVNFGDCHQRSHQRLMSGEGELCMGGNSSKSLVFFLFQGKRIVSDNKLRTALSFSLTAWRNMAKTFCRATRKWGLL